MVMIMIMVMLMMVVAVVHMRTSHINSPHGLDFFDTVNK
jgi:hypothetical protein